MSLLERIFFFDREVRRHAYPSARTIAGAFEVSLATGKRDICYLRDRLLAPLFYDSKRNGYSYGEAEFHLPFSESPRLVLLLAMLNKMAREAGLANLPEVRRLEHRLSSMISPQYRAIPDSLQCHWIEVEEIKPSIFESVVEALTQQRMLTVVYRSIGGTVTNRQVAPLQLVNHQGRWYLFGYCSLRQANRLFHLARVVDAGITTTALPKHLSFDSEELLATFGIFQGPPRYRAAILFISTAADLVARQHWHRDQVVSRVEDGVILDLPVGDDRELVMKILQYGAMARVLSPPRLVQRVREALGSALALYEVPRAPSIEF